MNSRNRSYRSTLFLIAIAAAGLIANPAQASTSQLIATGTMEYSELLGGPATLTVRRLIVAPGEVLGWHAHPGVGAYTVVVRGTLTVEDGCGGETVYNAGQAFLEPANRVHRGKNLGSVEVETVQTFLVPVGTPLSIPFQQPTCGAPYAIEECRVDGWMSFTHPRPFSNQGDCTQYVITGQ